MVQLLTYCFVVSCYIAAGSPKVTLPKAGSSVKSEAQGSSSMVGTAAGTGTVGTPPGPASGSGSAKQVR